MTNMETKNVIEESETVERVALLGWAFEAFTGADGRRGHRYVSGGLAEASVTESAVTVGYRGLAIFSHARGGSDLYTALVRAALCADTLAGACREIEDRLSDL